MNRPSLVRSSTYRPNRKSKICAEETAAHAARERDAQYKLQALGRRVENYKRREVSLQREVAEAAARVDAEKRSNGEGVSTNPGEKDAAGAWMSDLDDMRVEIDGAFEHSKSRTDEILEDQQRDMMRAFKSKLFDRKRELAAMRAARDEKASGWIARVRRLEADYEYAKEASSTMQRNASTLMARNRELKGKNAVGGRAREGLIQELVLNKRARAQLREELVRITAEEAEVCHAPASIAATEPTPSSGGDPPPGLLKARALRDALADARKWLAALRERHNAESRLSADLRGVLKQFADAVRARIDHDRAGFADRTHGFVKSKRRPRSAAAAAAAAPRAATLYALGPTALRRPSSSSTVLDLNNPRARQRAPQPFRPPRASAPKANADLDLQLRVVATLARLAFPPAPDLLEQARTTLTAPRARTAATRPMSHGGGARARPLAGGVPAPSTMRTRGHSAVSRAPPAAARTGLYSSPARPMTR